VKALDAQAKALANPAEAGLVAAEKGVLLSALVKVRAVRSGKPPSKMRQKRIKTFSFLYDPGRSEASQHVLWSYATAMEELQAKLLDAEMAERSQDGFSPQAAMRIQNGLLRKRLARKKELEREKKSGLRMGGAGGGGGGEGAALTPTPPTRTRRGTGARRKSAKNGKRSATRR
jgi:hypothetical protein